MGKLVAKISLKRSPLDIDKIVSTLKKKLKKYVGKEITRELESKIYRDIVSVYETYLEVAVETNFIEEK